jgi:hypothetical protein
LWAAPLKTCCVCIRNRDTMKKQSQVVRLPC